jgi:hypothetical protein
MILKMMHIIKRRNICFFITLIISATGYSQKIDLNMTGRPSSEVTENNYTAWNISESAKATLRTGNIFLTLSSIPGNKIRILHSNWWKQGLKNGQKLVEDGVSVWNTNQKGDIANITSSATTLQLIIKGLPAGYHSLLAYHNIVDSYSGEAAPIDIYVNHKIVSKGIQQSIRAILPSQCGQSYITFYVTTGKDVIITYQTHPIKDKHYATTSLYINGLIFDEPNPKTTALNPSPTNGNMHVDADNGTIKISWQKPFPTSKSHLYFGTSPDKMKEIAVTTDTCYNVNRLTNLSTYYWRVDEENENDSISKGEVWVFRPRHLAFPRAEGYGKYATGGRGGSVYHVTSLQDDSVHPRPGTFRYGITEIHGPRTIVFDVGGVIALKDRLTCSDPYVTIAGQTAPGNGIMFRDCPLGVASEGITRFIRMRLGHKPMVNGKTSHNNKGLDGMGMAGNDNAIMDHCSISWTIDEAFSSRNAQSLTLQNSLISEALNVAGHPNYHSGMAHGFAATIGGGENSRTLKVGSFHHNLLVDCEGRNWSISGGLDGNGAYDGHHDIFNNVVYNWGNRACDGGSHEINFVNNFYKMGTATTQPILLRLQLEGRGTGTQSAYVHGNIRQEKNNGRLTMDKYGVTYRYELTHGQVLNWKPFTNQPFFQSLAKIETAKAAFKNVLSDVGCNEPALDNHDTRMIKETLTGTTTTTGSRSGKPGLIDSEKDKGCEDFSGLDIYSATRPAGYDTDGDGMPDWWEKAKGLNPDVADNNEDSDGDGYTNLEDYLNWMAAPHLFISTGKKLTVDMTKYFAGYNHHPYFKIITDDNLPYRVHGTQYIFHIGKRTGFHSIKVTATDQDGWGSLTRTINIYVSNLTPHLD